MVICFLPTRLLCVEHIFQDRIAFLTGEFVPKCHNSPIEFSSPKEAISKLRLMSAGTKCSTVGHLIHEDTGSEA